MYRFRIFWKVIIAAVLGLAAAGASSGAFGQVIRGHPEEFALGGQEAKGGPFSLFRDRDVAMSDIKLAGTYEGCTENSGLVTWFCWYSKQIETYPYTSDFFPVYFYVAAPSSERARHTAAVPSLAEALGKGYTVNSRLSSFAGELMPHDGTLGPYHSGVQVVRDASCQDHVSLEPGSPLLAGSDCPPTWGTQGWQGSRIVDEEGFLAYADQVGGTGFSFDPWRVPESLQIDSYMGSFQTFGYFSDYSAEALFGATQTLSYGSVIPEAMGGDPTETPTRTGWPLGIQAKYDAYSFALPGLQNTAFIQFTVANNSLEVYGVDLDYDSLYMGLQVAWWSWGQWTSSYRDPATGATRTVGPCLKPGCNGAYQPPHGPGWIQFPFLTAEAIVALKSPIGDLRNKLFSDPGSPFFGMGDPESWDDTITFNHGHFCGYHSCSQTTWSAPGSTLPDTDYEQRQFGMAASITSDVIGDRQLTEIDAHTMWDTWRWEEAPDVGQLDFNKWSPGGWDFDEDGQPDTLYFDDCSGSAGPQYDPVTESTKPCAVTWSDTMPGGFLNVYANQGSVLGAGPFELSAGDTVQWLFAIVMANDSATFENDLAKAIDHYMGFYLGPEPPPQPNIVSVDVEPGDSSATLSVRQAASVTLYWDDAPEAWEDPWLEKLLDDLLAADPATELGKIRDLNPWVADTIAALIPNNVEAVYIFKSCDNGASFTTSEDCSDAPAPGDLFEGLRWLPWATIEPHAAGSFAENEILDDEVISGRSYLYSMLAVTRGLTVTVATGEVLDTTALGVVFCIEGCEMVEVELAPKLVPSISTSTTEPNVVSFYIPISHQAGSERSTVSLLDESPDYLPFSRMNVAPTADEVSDGEYAMAFGDSATVTEVAELTTLGAVVQSTSVALFATDGADTLEAPGPVALPSRTFSETIVGSTRTRVWSFDVLSAALLDEDDAPITVTDQLAGAPTVPGSYYGLENFPHFIFTIDNSVGGDFDSQYYLDADGDSVLELVEPAVTWRNDLASGVIAEGRFRVNWLDAAFGPASPFTLDFTDPEGTRELVTASIEARTTVLSSTDPEIASFLGISEEEMLAVDLPFEIENITAGAENGSPVHVVLTAADKQTSLLLGTGLDTLWVDVPETEWLPADLLVLVEGTAPDFRVTTAEAIIGCDANLWLRTECNPVALQSPGMTGYVETERGQELHFSYHQTITSNTGYRFEVASAVTGNDILRAGDTDAIRASLDSVKVVPNPFVMFSDYSTSSGQDRVMFTHVPPRGVLRMYTVTGQFVQRVNWDPNDLNGQGDLWFDLRTREGNEMAAGLYLFVLTAKDDAGVEIGTAKGKFVIIR